MTEEIEGMLEFENMYIALVVSKEETRGWISSRMVMSDSWNVFEGHEGVTDTQEILVNGENSDHISCKPCKGG